MNKKILYPAVVLLAGLILAALIGSNEPEIQTEAYAPMATTVRVITVHAGAEYLSIKSQGSVQPKSQSELIPEVSGRVTWISPSLVSGGAFELGEPLLRIDNADYTSLQQRSLAALDRSEVEFTHSEEELERLSSLHKRQLASQQQLDNAKRTARVAQANLRDARASLEQATRDLERTQLNAPFDGFVRSEQVDVGQFVTRGQSIGTLYASDFVEIRLPISADQLRYLGLPISTRGLIPEDSRLPVTIAADFGDARLLWEAPLVRLEAEIDERSRMLYGVAQLEIDGTDGRPFLPVGMFVQADIRGSLVENIIRLPRSAIRDNDQVLVVDSNNQLRFRQVSILRLEHDDILIREGLKDGELVCISPLQTVVDGMRVDPVLE